MKIRDGIDLLQKTAQDNNADIVILAEPSENYVRKGKW